MARYLSEHGLETLWDDIEQYVGSQTDGTAESDGSDAGPIVELTAKGKASQVATTGKNLWPHGDCIIYGYEAKSISLPAGTYVFSTVITSSDTDSTTCLISYQPTGGTFVTIGQVARGQRISASFSSDTTIDKIRLYAGSAASNSAGDTATYADVQIELGSTATSYEPYTGGAPSPSPDYPQEIQVARGHEVTGKAGRFVDIDVYDGSTHVSTIPVPLPQRGWVGVLPDGTADTLTLDGAGGYVWTMATDEITLDGSSDEVYQLENSGKCLRIGVAEIATESADSAVSNALCDRFAALSGNASLTGSIRGFAILRLVNGIRFSDGTGAMNVESWTAWLSTHPVTVLYPLATPTTESGYTDMPTIPEGATLSCAELDALHVRFCADGVAAELARQWYERARSEYEDRIAALEEAVAEIIAG